jgi:hypothetical protein
MTSTDTLLALASAEIVDDLREAALVARGESHRSGCHRCGISASLADDAADMIERLTAERDAAIARASAA